MTWDEARRRSARSSRDGSATLLGPGARAGRAELDAAPRATSPPALQAVLEEVYLHAGRRRCSGDRRSTQPLPGRRRRAQLRRERHASAAQTPFDDLYVQPAAGDDGTAVGAAFYVWHQVLGRPRGFVMGHAYTGPAYSTTRRAQPRCARPGSTAERLDDDELFAARRRARSPPATSSAGSRAGWSWARAPSATARSSPTRAAPT